ncbi:MAG: signal peptidase I, partial [Spirochaetaceae bacterium]|nr:signal peptidase I [Spirochaetaceae bacterium]
MRKKPTANRPVKDAAAPSPSTYGDAARPIPVLAYAWAALAVASPLLSGCPRFTPFYAAYAVISLGLAAGAVLFARAIWKEGKARLLPAFKKFFGYGLVLHYAASALPRVDWSNAGLIGQGRIAYLFVLACVAMVLGFALFVMMGRPATYAALRLFTEEEARDASLRKKKIAAMRKKGFVFGALDWIDAIGFAAVLVILVNTFVFQLYEIPSESMVPAFLKKDRPFTAKFLAGPRIPLTDWRLPFVRLPARGDIVTLANPRYPENASVNLKKYLGQLVQMITFTTVNIDRYLPDGSEKADPLVKRIVGLPGEKLMMVDDVLYARSEGD